MEHMEEISTHTFSVYRIQIANIEVSKGALFADLEPSVSIINIYIYLCMYINNPLKK